MNTYLNTRTLYVAIRRVSAYYTVPYDTVIPPIDLLARKSYEAFLIHRRGPMGMMMITPNPPKRSRALTTISFTLKFFKVLTFFNAVKPRLVSLE